MTTEFVDYAFNATGGTHPRTMPDRLLDVINVKNYGAVGDNSTDNFTAIMEAITWNSIEVVAAAHVYTGAVRFTSLTWSSAGGGTVTAVTGGAHGLTIGDVIFSQANFGPGTVALNGIFTVLTVPSPTTFTWAGTMFDPGPVTDADLGYFTAAVTSMTWATNVATINFGAPHRLISGLTGVAIDHFTKNTTMTVSAAASGTGGVIRLTVNSSASTQTGESITVASVGGSPSANGTWVATVVDGTHIELQGSTFGSGYSSGTATNTTNVAGFYTITSTGARTLTFPLPGSGALSVSSQANLTVPAVLQVVSWPGIPSFYPQGTLGEYYMNEVYPVAYAASYLTKLASVVGTTLTFGAFWADINAGDTIRLVTPNIGQLWFPPGTYRTSQQIKFPTIGITGVICGIPGCSIIRGNFPSYLVASIQKAAGFGPVQFNNLTFVNDDTTAHGGGLELVAINGVVSGCKFVCGGVGARMASADRGQAISFGVDLYGCLFTPTSGAASAIGLQAFANNGEYRGNYFKGLATAIEVANFSQSIDGNLCIDCGIGINWGAGSFTSDMAASGNAFYNCGQAVYGAGWSGAFMQGTYIEGGADATRGIYGLQLGDVLIRGAYVKGAFSTSAIHVSRDSYQATYSTYRSVGAENSGVGVAWVLPATQAGAFLLNCNVADVITYDGLTGRYVASLSYNSGTGVVTLTTDSTHFFTHTHVSISGVTVGGSLDTTYNGVYTPISQSGSTITYEVFAPPEVVNILPVGDSITVGLDTTYGSYRKRLYDLMVTGHGYNIDFVGPLSNGTFPDPQHDGVAGDVVNGAWGRIAAGRIELYSADVVILLIGTNDVWQFEPNNAVTITTYGHLLDSIAAHGPRVKTLVCSLPPISVTTMASVTDFNTRLAALVATYDSTKFFFVDLYAGMTTGDLADGVHPTNAGSDKMADIIYAAYVAAGLSSGILDAGTGCVVSTLNSSDIERPVKSCSWSGGVVTVETLGPHGLGNKTQAFMGMVVGGNYSNGFNGGSKYATPDTVTVIDDTHFAYLIASDPGTVDSASLSPSVPSFPNIPASAVYINVTNGGNQVNLQGLSYDSAQGVTRANLSNGQKLGGGTANIGDLVIGGGSQHVSVAWTRGGWKRRA